MWGVPHIRSSESREVVRGRAEVARGVCRSEFLISDFRLRIARRLQGVMVALAFGVIGAVDATEPKAGELLPKWERGMLDIHQINTGTGDAAFFVFPDGTTLLLDAAGVNRAKERPPNYDTRPRPDGSRRAGEWVARYVQRMHPEGERGALDYAMLTHFHGDHMGTLLPESPNAKSGAYRLTGITDVGEAVPIRRMLDR